MKYRMLLTFLFAGALVAWTLDRPSVSAKDLDVGSQAPALDIEHWVQDGNGFFAPVKEFKKGKVYVVEFWATWCGPCIDSMPHLAELQNQYRGRGVQIISVSDESLDEVKDLLNQENEAEGKTFAEITAAYSLTTDPDGSVYSDYMEAAEQQGIPTSFIVGKMGVIEWIGHPAKLDAPLEAVVSDEWDREAFKKQLRFQEGIQRTVLLARSGKFDEAIELLDAISKDADSEQREQCLELKSQLKLAGGILDDELLAFYRKRLQSMNAFELSYFGGLLYGKSQEGVKVERFSKIGLAAVSEVLDSAEGIDKVALLNARALLKGSVGDITGAMKAQQAAMESSTNELQKERLKLFLDVLGEQKEKNAAEPSVDEE